MKLESDDYDSPWKGAIIKQFRPFMDYFFPKAAVDIDWSRPPVNLDKEFQSITRVAKNAKRSADALVKVYLKSGLEQWVLIHIEVQSQPDHTFEERMYIYNYRIFDLYKKRVASFAILADQNTGWRPAKFEYEIWGCRASLTFPSVKFLDLSADPRQLLSDKNPFALLVLAHMKTQETRSDLQSRKKWKIALTINMLRLGVPKKVLLEMVGCIDLMMQLPHNLQLDFNSQLENMKEYKSMPYVSFIEKNAMERGWEKGLEKGVLRTSQENIITILRTRFGRVPMTALKQIKALTDSKKLGKLLQKAVTVQSLKEFKI